MTRLPLLFVPAVLSSRKDLHMAVRVNFLRTALFPCSFPSPTAYHNTCAGQGWVGNVSCRAHVGVASGYCQKCIQKTKQRYFHEVSSHPPKKCVLCLRITHFHSLRPQGAAQHGAVYAEELWRIAVVHHSFAHFRAPVYELLWIQFTVVCFKFPTYTIPDVFRHLRICLYVHACQSIV